MKLNAAYRLTAVPALIESQDFGLSDLFHNKQFLQGLMHDKSYKKVKFAGFELGKVSQGKNAIAFFLPRKDFIVYYVQLSKIELPQIGEAVMQTAVWRALGKAPPGITSAVFERIIDKYKIIVSDSLQTKEGRSFWVARLQEAFDKGHKVALLHKQTRVDLTTEEELDQYLNPKSFSHAWGTDESFADFRFIIIK